MIAAKTHLLGRDETGATKEPPDVYDDNDQVEFERYFHGIFSSWTQDELKLKLKCEDCAVESEDVSSRSFEKQVPLGIGDMTTTGTQYHNLCQRCYDKRTTASTKPAS